MTDQRWTPGPWRYEPGGGHAPNRIVGSDLIQTLGWPERRNGVSNASYSETVCENLGDASLPGPAANVRLIAAAPEMAELLRRICDDADTASGGCDWPSVVMARVLLERLECSDD